MVEQILSILPPKSLKRFKTVSKRWYALISSPRFVANHLHNPMHNNTSVFTIRRILKDNSNTDETEDLLSFIHFQNDHDNDGGADDDDKRSFVSSIQDIHIPFPTGRGIGESLIITGHCNGIICLARGASGEVILCNLAIHEYTLLPPSPYLPASEWQFHHLFHFGDGLGFGYDPNLNEYKVINIGYSAFEEELCKGQYYPFNIYSPPKAAVYTLGTDSWREIMADSLETETAHFWPEKFQMHFKHMCFWQGLEQHKELELPDDDDDGRFIRKVIIMFDTGNELFHDIMLPDEFDYPSKNYYLSWEPGLFVWKDSVALLGTEYRRDSQASFAIWVLDELGGPNGGAWTKYITFDLPVAPLLFWKSDEVLLNGAGNTDYRGPANAAVWIRYRGPIFSYNLGTKKLINLRIQINCTDISAIVYVNSIVPVLRGNNLKNSDSSTSKAEVSVVHYSSPPFSHNTVDKKTYHYSVWALPSDDVSLRIKRVMEELRAEFGGPEIDPHITVVGSIRMAHEDMLNKFKSLPSCDIIYSYNAKVNQVVTRSSYFRCVSLLIESSRKVSPELHYATGKSGGVFDFMNPVRPHLSLLYGYLTEEERQKAKEKVGILDEGLGSLSFPITQLALYKIDYKDRSLKSWEKIAELPLASI